MTPGLALIAVVVLALITAAVAGACEVRARGCETSAPAAFSREKLPTTPVGGLDPELMLWAIRQRESGDNPRAIGKRFGERSAYQFRRDTWAGLTRAPFTEATKNPRLAHAMAVKHLAFIRGLLAARGIDSEAPQFIAAAWNFGPAFGENAVRSDYAAAVANLYWDGKRRAAR